MERIWRGVCFLLLIFLFISASPRLASAEPKVVKIAGKAQILKASASAWTEAERGTSLSPGESIRVVGKGEVELQDADGLIIVTAKDDTTVAYDGVVDGEALPWKNSRRLKILMESVSLEKNRPTTQFSSPAGTVETFVTPGLPLNFVTPLIAAAVRGTRFETRVEKDATSSVSVTEGTVSVYDRMGNASVLQAGESITVTSSEYTTHLSALGISAPDGFDWRGLDQRLLEILDDTSLQKHNRMNESREHLKNIQQNADRARTQTQESGGDGSENYSGGAEQGKNGGTADDGQSSDGKDNGGDSESSGEAEGSNDGASGGAQDAGGNDNAGDNSSGSQDNSSGGGESGSGQGGGGHGHGGDHGHHGG